VSRVAKIQKAQRALSRAERNLQRACRLMFCMSRRAKWDIVCSPTPDSYKAAIGKAVLAQNAAIAAGLKLADARRALAAAWRA
jgi:hypothetical protein